MNTVPTLDMLQAEVTELRGRGVFHESELLEIVRRLVIPALSSLGHDTSMLASRQDVIGLKAALFKPGSDLDRDTITAMSQVMLCDTKTVEALLFRVALIELMRLLGSREFAPTPTATQGESA